MLEQIEAGEEFAKWRMKWEDCLTMLRRPSGEPPAAVDKAIELIGDAHSERRALSDLEHRVAGMTGNIAAFEAGVAHLVAIVAQDLIGRPTEFAAEELRRRLLNNRQIEARRLRLLEEETEGRLKLDDASQRLSRASATLEDLRGEIGGGTDEEIANRIALATVERRPKQT